MEDEYEVIDRFTGLSIEKGDLIRTAAGFEIVVDSVEHVDGGYEIRYLDWEIDEYSFLVIGEDEFVDLLG